MTKHLRGLVLAVSILGAGILPLAAQTIDDAGKAAISARVDEFGAVMSSGDMSGTFAFTPPKVKEHMASQFGMTVADLESAVSSQMAEAMAMVTIDSFGMDVAAATYETTPDGSRGYALIPTTTVMTVEGAGKMQATSQTLAMEDEGVWYLVRIDDAQQVGILQAVYPEFGGVTFPQGAMTAVE